MGMKRLTKNEWSAICTALAQCLAGEEIDGFYPDDEIRAAMESAHRKASERL